MRGETRETPAEAPEQGISIHSPHAGRDAVNHISSVRKSIFQSTLPMRGETECDCRQTGVALFQSTLPMRGETSGFCQVHYRGNISIHSPHAGRDIIYGILIFYVPDFNPLSPCGERQTLILNSVNLNSNFNPLSPCGERQNTKAM